MTNDMEQFIEQQDKLDNLVVKLCERLNEGYRGFSVFSRVPTWKIEQASRNLSKPSLGHFFTNNEKEFYDD